MNAHGGSAREFTRAEWIS